MKDERVRDDYTDEEWEELSEEEQDAANERTKEDMLDMMFPNGQDPD